MQAQVGPRRRPGGGPDGAVADGQGVRVDPDRQVLGGQPVGDPPVRRRPASVEHTGPRQEDRTGAERRHGHSGRDHRPEGRQRLLRHRREGILPPGYEHEIASGQRVQGTAGDRGEAARERHRSRLEPHGHQCGPRYAVVAAVDAPHLDRDPDLEGPAVGQEQQADRVHGRNRTTPVLCATRPAHPFAAGSRT